MYEFWGCNLRTFGSADIFKHFLQQRNQVMSSFLPSIPHTVQTPSPSPGKRVAMGSVHMGALKESTTLPIAQLSYPPSGVRLSKCKKRWNNAEEKLARPTISQRRLLTSRCVGFQNHGLVPSENDQFKPLNNHIKTFREKLDAFYRFTRPHVFISKIWSTVSVSLLAAEKFSDITPRFVGLICLAIIAAWFLHVYIVGLNQLTDIEIDKVNKPDRPLVTGEYSINTGLIIISASAIMSLLVGWIVGSWALLCSLLIGFITGTVYSVNVPFLRWKRIPFAATLCFLSLLVTWPLGNYVHVKSFVLGQPAIFNKAAIVAISFASIFAVSLTQFKDIPDIEGDRLDGIQTLAVLFGAEKVFWVCIGLLQFAYLVVISAALTSQNSWRKFILICSQMILASVVWSHARSVDLESKVAVESFHGFMWKLVSLEYFLIHLMR